MARARARSAVSTSTRDMYGIMGGIHGFVSVPYSTSTVPVKKKRASQPLEIDVSFLHLALLCSPRDETDAACRVYPCVHRRVAQDTR